MHKNYLHEKLYFFLYNLYIIKRHSNARENAKLAVEWAREELKIFTQTDKIENLLKQKEYIDQVPKIIKPFFTIKFY